MSIEELPELENSAGFCGSGEAVTGPFCGIVAIAIWAAAVVWEAS